MFVVRVCILLVGFYWVDRGRFLAHTQCQNKHLSVVKQKYLHAPHSL